MRKLLLFIFILGMFSPVFAENDTVVDGVVSSIRILPSNAVDFSISGHENIRICKANSSEPILVDPENTLVYKHILRSFQEELQIQVTYRIVSNPNSNRLTKCLLYIKLIK